MKTKLLLVLMSVWMMMSSCGKLEIQDSESDIENQTIQDLEARSEMPCCYANGVLEKRTDGGPGLVFYHLGTHDGPGYSIFISVQHSNQHWNYWNGLNVPIVFSGSFNPNNCTNGTFNALWLSSLTASGYYRAKIWIAPTNNSSAYCYINQSDLYVNKSNGGNQRVVRN